MWTRLLVMIAIVMISGCSFVGVQGVSEPGFQVELEDGAIEVRRYSPILLAETEVNGRYEEIGKEGFKRLSGYIFGNNERQEEMDMTAPVLQQGEDSSWRMSFVLPEEYRTSTAPSPLDDQVVLKEVPGKRVAVLKYSGSVSAEVIAEKASALAAWLEEHDFQPVSPPRSARYDPPWTIPVFRRNEIQIDIE